LALYGVPLMMGADFLGVAVMGSRSSREFSQEDQSLFRTMANRVAALIAQARLDTEIARRVAELEAVLESIPEGIYVGDASGIKRANRAALEMLGYRSVEDLNRDVTAVASEIRVRRPDGQPVPNDELVFVRALRGEAAASDVMVRNRATGADVIVHSSAAPIRLGDRIVGAVAVNSDITARMEEQAELQAALDFRDRILGVLSHDVRNPLAVVLTSANLLQRQLATAGNERQLAAVKRITDNAQTIERMVRDLIDYTRARHGRGLPIVVVDADLLELCRQVVDGMQVLHPDRPLQLTATGDTTCRVDPDRATQVISNLVGNALLYSPPGSPVTITLTGEEEGVVLEVNNRGPPIPAEMLPHVFEPFQRGAADGGRPAAGLGLGLYIASQIVEAHDGSISVRSDERDGTTFTVLWPRERR
jgi:PAS domain S-box-containing protein